MNGHTAVAAFGQVERDRGSTIGKYFFYHDTAGSQPVPALL